MEDTFSGETSQKVIIFDLCESCGGYHKRDEMEEVFVRVFKGKNCELNIAKENTFKPLNNSEPKHEDVHITTPVPMVHEEPQPTWGRGDIDTTESIIPPGLRRAIAAGQLPLIPPAGGGNGARGAISPGSVFGTGIPG